MLKIRLKRTGKKGQPSFDIIVVEHTKSVQAGKYAEKIGYYRPADDPKVFELNLDRFNYWISVGAKPSDTVASLVKYHHKLDGMDKYIGRRDKQSKKKKEEPEEEAPNESSAPQEEAPAEQPEPAEATE